MGQNSVTIKRAIQRGVPMVEVEYLGGPYSGQTGVVQLGRAEALESQGKCKIIKQKENGKAKGSI